MLKVVNCFALILIAFTLYIPTAQASALVAPNDSLIFTEVKVRYDSTNPSDYDEFIEIYNNSAEPISLNDFSLEYFNVTNPTNTQLPTQKPIDANILGAHEYFVISKQPLQIGNSKLSPFSSLADGGGRLRLVTNESVIIDEIAWGNSTSLSTAEGVHPAVLYQCNASTVVCNSNKTLSINRLQAVDLTYPSLNYLWQLATPTPLSSELTEPIIEVPDEETPDDEPDIETPSVTCEGLVISEVLPNPAGSDANKEFIEIFNPTEEVISLDGCELQTSVNTKSYAFSDVQLQPGEYKAFYDTETNLSLANNAGGTVWLLSPTDEISESIYPSAMSDDTSWAISSGVWQLTYALTPNAVNVIIPFKPCAAEQVRNVETNKCTSTTTSALQTMVLCKAGQERNPETGRCRSTIVAASTLVACKEGQERNPETNRCRNSTSDDELQPCPEGQERNLETNRCRKVTNSAAGTTLAAVTDVPSKSVKNDSRWLLAVVALLLALGYAVYEWRQDIKTGLTKLVTKIKLK